jgi:hypothetical protein
MTKSYQSPTWAKPVDLGANWPTKIANNPALCYSLPLPAGWARASQTEETPLYSEDIYRGGYAAELAVISYMPQANPAHNIRNWVEGILVLTGFPVPALVTDELPRLLEWGYEGTWPALAEHLGVDECHTYQGLAHLPGTESEVARFYILLARRGQQAWKVTLSFLSACLPGMPEEMVYENDHVRAGATFGTLKLLPAETAQTQG